MLVMLVMGVVEAVITIVGRSLLRVGEHRVGGGDFCEALAGGWVGAVAVGVVAEGEGVEFSDFLSQLELRGLGREGQGVVRVRVRVVDVGVGVLLNLRRRSCYRYIKNLIIILFSLLTADGTCRE
jgi:hypothetical protein